MDGGTSDGPEEFGCGAEIVQTWVSGTAQVTDWEWESSPDDSTWYKAGYIGSSALAAAGTIRFKTAVKTRHRYVRLLATNTGTGASTSVAYAEDMGGIGNVAVANA
jgi:hypothetical protein